MLHVLLCKFIKIFIEIKKIVWHYMFKIKIPKNQRDHHFCVNVVTMWHITFLWKTWNLKESALHCKGSIHLLSKFPPLVFPQRSLFEISKSGNIALLGFIELSGEQYNNVCLFMWYAETSSTAAVFYWAWASLGRHKTFWLI